MERQYAHAISLILRFALVLGVVIHDISRRKIINQ